MTSFLLIFLIQTSFRKRLINDDFYIMLFILFYFVANIYHYSEERVSFNPHFVINFSI